MSTERNERNEATQAAALYLDNEADVYKRLRAVARELAVADDFTAYNRMRDVIDAILEAACATDDIEGRYFMRDMINIGLSQVDSYDLATDWINEVRNEQNGGKTQ